MADERRRVLIVCMGNSCRSQMAEVVWRALGGERWEVVSAGTRPKGVDPRTLAVLQERGYPTTGLRSKHVSEVAAGSFDLVVTVCDSAREECPVWPNAGQVLHWPFPDPAAADGTDEEQLELFRAVLELIEDRIRSYLKQVDES